MKFSFKEFSVNQAKSAAKITTDATIFAAWMPIPKTAKKILEVCTGTGVLSLMLAQRFPDVRIDAVEIEQNAFNEASANFKNSVFSDRLAAHHAKIQSFQGQNQYDVLFSNPPFFENNLQSENNIAKNTAYHTNTLTFAELAKAIEGQLKPTGDAFIMLPFFESKLFEKVMRTIHFSTTAELLIKHNQQKPPLRRLMRFNKNPSNEMNTQTLMIRNEDGRFSEDYQKLLRPFLTIF